MFHLNRHIAHRRRAEARQMQAGIIRLLRVHRPGANFSAAEVMPTKQAAEAHLKACELDYLTEVL